FLEIGCPFRGLRRSSRCTGFWVAQRFTAFAFWFWVAQRFTAAINDAFPVSALAAAVSPSHRSMPPTRNIEVLATAADLFHAAAEEFVRAARDAIGAQGRFTVALSGGSTPKALYSLLASNYAGFVWNRVFLFFGDERHVPPTDPESNYRMVQESLLAKIKPAIPAENVFRVPAENPDAAAAASDYETQVRRFF